MLPVRCYSETLTRRRNGDPFHPFPHPTITSSFFTLSSVSASCLINLARADLACAHTLPSTGRISLFSRPLPRTRNLAPWTKARGTWPASNTVPGGQSVSPFSRFHPVKCYKVQYALVVLHVISKCTGKQPLAALARQIPDAQYRQGRPLP